MAHPWFDGCWRLTRLGLNGPPNGYEAFPALRLRTLCKTFYYSPPPLLIGTGGYDLFQNGVPIMLLRLVYIVLVCLPITGQLDAVEMFAGSECVLNGLKYFNFNAVPYEILRSPVP